MSSMSSIWEESASLPDVSILYKKIVGPLVHWIYWTGLFTFQAMLARRRPATSNLRFQIQTFCLLLSWQEFRCGPFHIWYFHCSTHLHVESFKWQLSVNKNISSLIWDTFTTPSFYLKASATFCICFKLKTRCVVTGHDLKYTLKGSGGRLKMGTNTKGYLGQVGTVEHLNIIEDSHHSFLAKCTVEIAISWRLPCCESF